MNNSWPFTTLLCNRSWVITFRTESLAIHPEPSTHIGPRLETRPKWTLSGPKWFTDMVAQYSISLSLSLSLSLWSSQRTFCRHHQLGSSKNHFAGIIRCVFLRSNDLCDCYSIRLLIPLPKLAFLYIDLLGLSFSHCFQEICNPFFFLCDDEWWWSCCNCCFIEICNPKVWVFI